LQHKNRQKLRLMFFFSSMFHVFNNSGIFAAAHRPDISGSHIRFFFFADKAMPSAHARMNVIKRNKLTPFSSKFGSASRIWLCLPVTNDGAERAFSNMKRTKKGFRSSKLDLRLNIVCLMRMEKAYTSRS
jgi:hypothetical protein